MARQRLECMRFTAAFAPSTERVDWRVSGQNALKSADKSDALQTLRDYQCNSDCRRLRIWSGRNLGGGGKSALQLPSATGKFWTRFGA
jgi:hypothetical protein